MIQSTYKNNKTLREALYKGDVFLLEAEENSKELVEQVRLQLIETFGADYRSYEHSLDNDDFFMKISKLRKTIYLEPQFHDFESNLQKYRRYLELR